MVARSDDLSANENPNLSDGDDDSADDEESVGTAGCEPWKMALNCFLRSRFVLNFAPWIEYKECFLYWGWQVFFFKGILVEIKQKAVKAITVPHVTQVAQEKTLNSILFMVT